MGKVALLLAPALSIEICPLLRCFDLRGREWKENYYVNLNAWKITPEGPATADDPSGAPPPEEPGESVEDVPF